MTKRYEVQTHTLCQGWINCWTVTEVGSSAFTPETFPTREAAQIALDEFLAEIQSEITAGERTQDEGYSPEEFRIMEVMPKLTNEQRAEWAAHALDAYGRGKEGRADYDAPEDMAADLICDLLHLIRAHDADPIQKIEMAKINFETEERENVPCPSQEQ